MLVLLILCAFALSPEEQQRYDTLTNYLGALSIGDLATASTFWASNVQLTMNAEKPLVSVAGTYTGVDDILNNFFGAAFANFAHFAMIDLNIVALQNYSALVTFTENTTVVSTGKQYYLKNYVLYAFDQSDKIKSIEISIDSQKLAGELSCTTDQQLVCAATTSSQSQPQEPQGVSLTVAIVLMILLSLIFLAVGVFAGVLFMLKKKKGDSSEFQRFQDD